jgi:hypothetical protein
MLGRRRDAALRAALQCCESRSRLALAGLASLHEFLLAHWFQAGLSLHTLEAITLRIDHIREVLGGEETGGAR